MLLISWGQAKKHLGGDKDARNAIKRAKAHQLVVGDARKGRTHYDITNLGLEVLTEYNKVGEED